MRGLLGFQEDVHPTMGNEERAALALEINSTLPPRPVQLDVRSEQIPLCKKQAKPAATVNQDL
jgi:hypothetical protein